MREGAFDDEQLVGVDQGFVFEHAPEALDLVGPVGEVGQGAFMDLFTLTAAFAQEDGGGRVTVGDGFPVSWDNDTTYRFHVKRTNNHIHGNIISSTPNLFCKKTNRS